MQAACIPPLPETAFAPLAPTISMRTVNVLLVFAAGLCVLAGVAGTLAR